MLSVAYAERGRVERDDRVRERRGCLGIDDIPERRSDTARSFKEHRREDDAPRTAPAFEPDPPMMTAMKT